MNGRSHKRAAKKAQAQAEGKTGLGDTRQMRVATWDGTLNADGSHDDEPQVICYYDKSHNQGAMPPMHKYYTSTMAKKRAATAEAAEAAEAAGGEKRGAQGGAPDEPPARRQKKSMDPVAPYRRRIGLANRDGNVDDGLAAFDELHAAGLKCETKTGNSVLSLCAAAGAARWQDALRVYNEISERYSPDEGSYTCMIRLCGVTKQLDKGLELFEQMRESGIAPKRRTYSPLLEACAEQPDGSLQRALELLADAKSRDIETYEGDFAALVRSCTRAGAAGVLPCQQVVLPEMMDQCYTLSASSRKAVEEWAAQVPERVAAGVSPTVSKADSSGKLCGHRLQSLALTTAEATIMLDQVSSLACSDKKKTDHFVRFKSWVDRNGPFDVILVS
jgi:pentatricopeptide repeat protein